MPNITIPGLPPVTLPITAAATFLEVSVLEAGIAVSRKIAADDLQSIDVPGGADNNVQFNNAGAFGGEAGFLWDGINLTASKNIIAGLDTDTTPSFSLDFANNSSGQLQWRPASGVQFLLDFNDSTNLFRIEGTAANTNIRISAGANTGILCIPSAGTALSFADVVKLVTVTGGVLFDDSLYVREKAAADADIATQGQFWVRDDAPNTPMFTDDAGTDLDLSETGAPIGASYIVVGVDPDLTDERTLAPGFGITLVDGGAGNPVTLAFDVDESPVVVTGLWTFNRAAGGVSFGPSTELHFANQSDDSDTFLQALDGSIAWGIAGAGFQSDFMDFGISFIYFRFGAPLFIDEQAAAGADLTGKGQIWVRDDTPNVLMFTDDAGTDHVIAFV